MPFAKVCPRCGTAFMAKQQKVRYCSRVCSSHAGGDRRVAEIKVERIRRAMAAAKKGKGQ
jgi:hypothetical protein